jgi:YYY domain-containing protein
MVGLLIYLLLGTLLSQAVKMDYYLARFFSFLSLCLVSFILSFLFPFKMVFYLVLIAFVVYGLWNIYRSGFNFDFQSEIAFLLTFGFFLFLRSLIPEAFGAEKLMDFAFMNSVLNAERFHPPDPFFAGGTLNFYYYFGYVIGAAITLMSFSPPEIGFNIAIASIPAYFVMLSFGFMKRLIGDMTGRDGSNDCRNSSNKKFSADPTFGAALGTLFMTFSGNLYAVYEALSNFMKGTLPGFLFYWNATRVIDDATYGKTINEFPYFSFIHADFHAHFVAIPVKMLAAALLYEYFRDGKFGDRLENKIPGYFLIPVIFILFATNSWDAPIFLFMTFMVVSLRILRAENERRKELKRGIFILSASVISILVLYRTMETPSAGIILINERTSLWQFVLFFGLLLALVTYYLRDEIINSKSLAALSSIGGLVMYLLVPISPIVIPLLVMSFKKFLKRDFLSLLVFSALLVILSCEFIAIESRMNTFFKFYLAAWILLSIPASFAIFKSLGDRRVYKSIIILLLVLSLIYPVIATPVRHYKAEFSLDASKFIKDISENDYEAIQFLKNRKGVVLEVAAGCYGYGGRVAAFTANPTVVAWDCHEVQWRANPDELVERIGDVRTLYKSGDCKIMRKIVEKYRIDYIFLGYEERKVYGTSPEVMEKCFKEVFRSGGTRVYSTK